MRCRRARKLVPDYAAGLLSPRREEKLRGHLGGCGGCSDLVDRERLVDEVLADWPDIPIPEDGYHRLETRMAFLPPPTPVVRRGVIRAFVLPYAAGLATAAALLLLARAAFLPASAPDRPVDPVSTPVAERTAEPSPPLLPGERKLQFVDRSGGLVEVPWDAATECWLRQTLDPLQYEHLRNRMVSTPVDYEVR